MTAKRKNWDPSDSWDRTARTTNGLIANESGNLEVARPEEGWLVLTVKWLLVIWMMAYTTLVVVLLFVMWTFGQSAECMIFGMKCSDLPPGLIALVHSMLGGVLGAGVLGMVSFHQYVSALKKFDTRHAWGYMFAPLLGAVLGLVVFALLQSGLLVFSGNSVDENNYGGNLGYLAVGFLSGFGWYSATRRIEQLVSRFFSGGDRRRPSERPEKDAAGGQHEWDNSMSQSRGSPEEEESDDSESEKASNYKKGAAESQRTE